MSTYQAATHNNRRDHNNRRPIRILWLIFSLFIIYGVLIPFHLDGSKEAIRSNIAGISWIPFLDPDGSRASIPDVVQNIMLFLPFGFFGFLSLQPEKKFRIVRITFTGALFSLSIEIFQLFTMERTTSVTDFVMNTAGTFFGALAASIVVHLFSELLLSSFFQRYYYTTSFFPLLIFGGLVVIGSLQPFDFTLDVGSVWSKVKSLIHHPLKFSLIFRDEAVVFLRFLLFAYLCSFFFYEDEQNYSVMKGVGISCALGIILEGSQLIVASRMPTAQDVVVVLLGSLCGGILYEMTTIIKIPHTGLGIFIVFATFISIGIQLLSPFQLAEEYRRFNWIPFLPYYQRTTFVALSNFIESMLMYFPMGFILQYALPRKKPRFLSIGFIALGIAFFLEVTQGWIIGRYPDITDVLGSLVGALAGSWCCSEGWAAFDRYIENV